ncbi:T9SS type A sorting domain-containing protein, partial [bacterium]|nr:T9SS type A sorting domain-containing protein [bacterium]
ASAGPGHFYIYVMPDAFELADGEYSLTLTLETWEPPPGDFCAGPLFIEEFPFETVGTTADNTNSQWNPSPDEWYEFTLEESGNFYATLCGPETDFDTYLRLIADDCATQIAYDDDGPLCPDDEATFEPSELMLFLEADTYKLCVEGYSSNMGNYYLNAIFNPFTPGVGDFCDDPVIITELPFDTTATNLDNIDTYGNTSPDEWYSFDVLEEGLVTISLCEGTTFDSYIYLLASNCTTQIAVDNDGCGGFNTPSEMLRLLSPGTYLLCIEGDYGVNGGDYTLSIAWEEFNPPEGEYCESAIQIPFLPFEATGTTSDNMDTYGNSSPDEWYQFSLPVEGNVLISLCDGGTNFDSYLRLLSDDCVTQIDYNDDACSLQSELDLFLSSGTYKICVEGYSSNSGNYSLDVTTDAPSQGDNCLDPFVIEEFPFSDEWFTFGYSSYGFNPSPDVFYEFLLEEEGVYTFTTCMEETYEGYFDTRLLILAEDCEMVIYANDDDCNGAYGNWSTITTCLAQGLYYLVVEGYQSESGNYQLDCFYVGECDPCDPPECPDWGIDEVEPNDGSNDNPPTYDNIAPGEIHCGGVWSNAYLRDTDWYRFEVTAGTEVEFFLDGEQDEALVLYLIDESSGSPEILATGYSEGYCSDYSMTYTLGADGLYSVFVAYDDYYPTAPSSTYTLAWIDEEGVGTAAELPQDYQLAQNSPTPFNPVTTIDFSLPVTAAVELTVYDITGRQVALLVDDVRPAGNHSVQFDAGGMPSGLYVYLLRAGEHRAARKMVLVK